MKRLIIYWLPVAVMAGVIFLLSAQPDLKSPLPSLYDFIARKIGHFVEYAILGLLSARALRLGHRLSLKQAALGALFAVIIYAASDEFHQGFVHGRHPAALDVIIDTLGGLTGIALLNWCGQLRSRLAAK